MNHLSICIDSVKQEKLLKSIKLCNFKRKIQESPEKAKEDVRNEYERIYNKKLKSKSLIWKNNSTLFDLEGQQVRLIFEDKPLLIPPVGNTKSVRYPYCKYYIDSVPSLNVDVLIKIFSFFHGWELMNFRFVCRDWNEIIVNTNSFWKLHASRCPDEWNNLSIFKLYVKQMFLNAKKHQVISFLYKHENLFIYMCGLLLGHNNLRIERFNDEICVNLYRLTRTDLYFNEKVVSINLFLDAYRLSIL